MSNKIKTSDYDRFRCIADQCLLTCCQEWRIGIDEATLDKWKEIKLDAINEGDEKYPEMTLCDHVAKEDAGHVIALAKDKVCPFLNKKKLCRLVAELGEDFLSETCTTFPRQINKFDDRTEYSLDTGCPAVVDLLNEHQGEMSFHQEGTQTSSILYFVREMILSMIGDKQYTLTERMMMIFYVLLELLEQENLTEEKLNSYKDSKSLKPLAQAIRKMKFNAANSFWERNELFLDVVHNYRKQKLYVGYLEGIAVTAEGLEESYTDQAISQKNHLFETAFKAYEGLVKNYLVSEIFANCLMEEMNLEDMVIGFEWVTLEYAVLKQAIFLKWLMEGEKTIDYTMVRDYISVISRVTGYDANDIKEYLENSFEDIIWDWGYLALIVGNGSL